MTLPKRMTVMPPAGVDEPSAIEVPYQQGLDLSRNGWISTCLEGSGPTAERPYGKRGLTFHDTEIGALIIHDGQCWRDQLTGAVV